MYFPILRGRQFELLALRECVNQGFLSNKIIPVVEPVKVSSTYTKTVDSFIRTGPGGYNLAIFNPDLFECVSVSVYDIEKLQYTSKKVL